MSDNHQDIVAPHLLEAEAQGLAAKAIAWLQDQGIIAKTASRCGLGPDDEAYAPGPRWKSAAENHDVFLPLASNGVEAVIERTVFDTGGNGIELKCASCGETFEPGDAYIAAIEAWWGGDDQIAYACDRCGHKARLADWTGPWAFGFGCFGLRFWNWPPLLPQFVEQVATVLGSRVVVVRCRV